MDMSKMEKYWRKLMKKKIWKKGLAVALGLTLGFFAPMESLSPVLPSYAYTERPASINASSLNVRSGPGTNHSALAKLSRGASVTVINETTGADGRLWYQIRFTSGGSSSTGYVLSTYVKFPAAYNHNADFEAQLSTQGFPESYKDGLRQLHARYPNWVFVAHQTGLDWNTAVQNEMVLPRSLVHTSSISSYKSTADGAYNWDNSTWTGLDGSTWVAASEGLLSYYMDPRNFLDEVSVFQFLDHNYNANLQTREGLQQMIRGTFLERGVILNGSGSGASGGSSSGGNSSGGPGGSSSGSSGVIISPGGTGGSAGPSGSGSSSGNAPSVSPSSGGQGPKVEFVAPHASISRRESELVATGEVVVGAKPGSDSSGSQSSSGGSGTSNGTVTAGSPGAASTPSGNTASSGGQVSGSYVDIIMRAAAESGVNPYVLAAMIIQEQGSDARGRSISGTVSGYEGYYNYFNVGAYADGSLGAVERGLWYASQSDSFDRPWNTPEKSIIGGAQFYGTNYVKAGQDTFYLKKYNVQGSNMYKHQYMTNVDGAASEASRFAEAYSQSMKQTALCFKIPVYNNMPDTPCAKPTGDGSPNNKLGSLGVEGYALTPTFHRDTTSYDLIVDASVSNVNVYANVLDAKASVSGIGNIQLQGGNNEIRVQVKAQNGNVREYVIHVVRRGGGPTYNGNIGGGTPSAGTGSGTVSPGGNGSGTVSPGGNGSVTVGIPTSGGTGGAPTPGGSNITIVNPIN